MSFKEKLDDEALEYFNKVAQGKFSEQAVAFLNAYWAEVGDQADFIFDVAWDIMKASDMHFRNIQYHHQYTEGSTNKLNAGLYFYEKLCKRIEDEKDKKGVWADEKYAKSHPEMMTTIKRKRELKEKVDVNFDGCISMLEYLLYQYQEYANPADFCTRSMAGPDEHPKIREARLALEEVNKAIQAFEAEKARLEDIVENGTGVKKLRAKNMLAQLGAGVLMEHLNMSLIKAEAAVRKAVKLFGGKGGGGGKEGEAAAPSDGSIFWMKKDLEVKKKRYGKGKK